MLWTRRSGTGLTRPELNQHMADQPNPLRVGWSILRAGRTSRPSPSGSGHVDHGPLGEVLEAIAEPGIRSLPDHRPALIAYRDRLESTDPDTLSRPSALAYWINLYNAGALALAAEAQEEGRDTVLRVPGGFARPWAQIAGEELSLDDVEHGKIRRFGDPRIHGALVCGSASCPTLRYAPYEGGQLDDQLDGQMRAFLANGGARADQGRGFLRLSRVFLWYGGDFTRPGRMPTWLPARKQRLAAVVASWLPEDDSAWVAATRPKVEFAPYDWSLACSIA